MLLRAWRFQNGVRARNSMYVKSWAANPPKVFKTEHFQKGSPIAILAGKLSTGPVLGFTTSVLQGKVKAATIPRASSRTTLSGATGSSNLETANRNAESLGAK
jgi:hypothetical protein